jgi:O-antigen/teichoic acid export membrane protein
VPSIQTLYKTLAKDTTVYFIATVGAKLASMAVIPLAAYVLAAAQFAVYDEFLLINTLLTLLLLLGIDSAAAIKIPLTQDEDYHGHVLLFMLCVTGLVFAILLGLTASLTALGIWTSLPLWHSVFASFFSALQLIVFTFFRYKGKALHSALIIFVSAVLSTALGLLFIALDPARSVQSLLKGVVIGQLLGAMASLYLIKNKTVFRQNLWRKNEVFLLLRLGLPYVPASFAMWGRKSVDRYLIVLYFGDAGIQGAYALMSRLAELAQVALGTLGSACTPLVLRHYKEKSGQFFARKILYFSVAIACIATVIVWIFSSEVVHLLDRQKLSQSNSYIDYHSLLLPLTAAGLLSSLLYFTGFGFQIAQRSGTYAALMLGGFLIQAAFAISTLQLGFGLLGLAVSAIAGTALFTIVYILVSEKLYSFSYGTLNWLLPILGICVFSIAVSVNSCATIRQAQSVCVNTR